MEPGEEEAEPGTRNKAKSGTGNMEPGEEEAEPGTWNPEKKKRNRERGTRNPEQSKKRNRESGKRLLRLARFSEHGME
jgi:hypothetical protein